MRPFIGVTCSSDPDGAPRVNPNYVRALHDAGALPVPLPFISTAAEAQELLERLAGIVFSGGPDLDPALWGEPLHPSTELMHPARMTTEMLLARAVLDRRTPALGICGGMQALNVACGGSLHQHLPDVVGEIEHADPTSKYVQRHPVTAAAGSRLAALCGPSFAVNTSHHQAVNRLGAGLVVTARSPDGVVEALERPDAPFFVGVQWHPERMLEDDAQQRLLGALVAAARAAAT